MSNSAQRRETDLHEPLTRYLEGQGYSVHAEVRGCDLVARAPDNREPIIMELKTRLSLDLVVQAVDRKELSDAVYLAVPLEGSRGRIRNMAGIRRLLRRLEIGLIVVRFLRSGTRVEVWEHPRPFAPRRRERRRISMLREIDGRYAELDRAGQTSRRMRMTAYRQESLLVASLLQEHGESSPARLRRFGAGEKCGRILARNLYGWFDRVRHGVYRLTDAGTAALQHHAEAVAAIRRGREEKGGPPA